MISNYSLNLALSNSISALDTAITHVGVGTDTTTPVEADTTLGGEVDRNAEYSSVIGSNDLKSQVRFDTTDANGYTFGKIGSFSASSGGTMYTENLVTPYTKTATKKVIYINVINFSLSQS